MVRRQEYSRTRYGRTARRRRRNRRTRGDETLDRLFGLGRFAEAEHRERIMNWGQNRAEIEHQYGSALGRLQLASRPRFQRESGIPPSAPIWSGYHYRNRASMPGPMAENIIDPAIYISQTPNILPIQGNEPGNHRLGFYFNTH